MKEFKILSSVEYQEHITLENSKQEWRRQNPTINIENFKRYENKTIKTWKTIIQLPFPTSIHHNELIEILWSDLLPYLKKIGITLKSDDESGQYNNWFHETLNGTEEFNGLYRWLLKANFQKELWEIELYHTLPLFTKSTPREKTIDTSRICSSNNYNNSSGGNISIHHDKEKEHFYDKYINNSR